MASVTVKNVIKNYGNLEVVHGINLKGMVFAVQKALRQDLPEPAPAPDFLARMKRQLRAMLGQKRQPDPDTIQENTR